ncbi:hypothetical protein ABEB36_003950 [Hypothenemus hampei]|uniref:Cytochrome P450 n=1 Tax=Hypothenemus hampei TaxID=57062 RepID=A0ABD1F1Q2_HYPHA
MLRISLKIKPNVAAGLNFQKFTYADNMKTSAATSATGPDITTTDNTSTSRMKTETAQMVVPKMANISITTDVPASIKLDEQKLSPFDSIPGPHSLRFISKFWSHVPLLTTEITGGALFQVMNLGKFFAHLLSWGGNAKFFQKFFNVYGPVVRLHGPFGGDVVLISRPEHASIVFKNEGSQSVRAYLDSVEKYRLQHRKLKQAGPLLMLGSEWEKIQKTLEEPLENSVQHFKTIDSICDQFIDRVFSIRNLQDEMPKAFKNEILKYCLESVCSIAFKRKLGFLDPTGLSPNSDPGRILDGVNGAIEAIRKCEYGFHIWKFIETPSWRSLTKNCDTIDSVLTKYVERIQLNLRDKKDIKQGDLSLVEHLLLKEDVLVEDVMTVMLDMILVGATTTAHSVAFLLYDLAKVPRCQKKLLDEILRQPEDLTIDTLKNMKYLQACIKESMRLNPPIPILSRILTNDTVIHKYKIPKGTYVLVAVHLACLREEYFEDALKFNPERWLGQELSPIANELQNFSYMPYGYGPKSWQAQELAQMEIGLLIVKLLKKFSVEYNYGQIESSNAILPNPTKPLKFRFVDRV